MNQNGKGNDNCNCYIGSGNRCLCGFFDRALGRGAPQRRGQKHRAEPIGTFIVGIDGMHCDHCRVAIQECLNKIDGVSAKVSLSSHSATVRYTRPIEESELREAIEKTGYGVDYIKRQ